MTISLDPAVIPLGESLAANERRSLSNLVEILIVREHERRQVQSPPPQLPKEVAA